MLMLKCTLAIIVLHQTNFIYAQKNCPSQESILPCRCLVKGEEYQIWCSHSDLPRVLEGLKSIAQQIVNPIDELILENNYLPSLPGRTFSSIKILRLMLRYNGLERVSSDWLTGLEQSLMEIFLVEPQLRSIPDDSLSNFEVLQAITIQTKLMKRLPLFSGLQKLRYLQIESESLVELAPSNFKNNPNLEKIHISSSPQLTRLEANIFRDLPKLELINITDTGLNWMHPRALIGLSELKELTLIKNKFTDAGIVGRSGRELPKLETIKLDYNYIDRISEGTFVDLPALKTILLSNNRITEIYHGAFHRVPSLKKLILNRNIIKRIHPESFLISSSGGLEELLLAENDITYIEEVRSILDALPRLTFLDLSFNNIEAIPFGAIRGHPTLEHLNLDYNKLHLIDKEAFMAMPALRELRLKNNSLSDMLEPPFWNLPALKGLDLSGNFFKKLEPNLLVNLPSLRRLDLSGNLLSLIEPATFLPTPSLEHINISHNSLKFVHPATFRPLLHLYELDASYNQLMEFVPGLPRGVEHLNLRHNDIVEIPKSPSPDLDLPSLRTLDLSQNKIEYISKMSLSSLPNLKRLYIGKNFINNLDQKSLEGLNRLETLNLRENRLSEIHPNSFKHMTELKEANLENNRLDLFASTLFKRSPNLKKLDLSGNQIAEILPETLENNPEIQEIDGSNNVLVKFPKTLYGLRNLRKLDLTNNRIKNIDPDVLNSLVNIRELKLSKNYIQELKEGVFHNLQHLKVLEIANNEVNYIEPNAVQLLPALKILKITRNKITEIPDGAFNTLPSLQAIELQENEIRNIAPNAFNHLPQLLMLNLSHNQILNLEESGIANLGSLEVLDLSFNKISRLSSSSLQRMEWLVELKIDNNEICRIQGSGFNNMPRLRVISLRHNRIISFPEQAVQRLRGNIGVLDIDGNPLACSCNLLWLQAWLQESSQAGPRCADGILLREMRISRDDCPEEERNREITAPECDAELLSYPGAQGISQVFAKWTNLKNGSKGGPGNKNSLAPSPEESDYFYDEYVDYPYNESMLDTNGYNGGKYKEKEHLTEKVPLTTTQYQQKPGETPTIYAAPKNQSKVIPQKVPNSPSSSGFTFFGVPLPNLNKLFAGTGGVGRMEDSHSSPPPPPPSAPVTAQRKVAIVNDPMRTTSRVSMGNIQSDFEHLGKPRPERNRMEYLQPPAIPQYEGGFVPMLPGSGGFKPIPTPITQAPFDANSTEKTNVISTMLPPSIPTEQATTNFNKKTITEETVPLYQTKLEKLATSYATQSNYNENDTGSSKGTKNTTKGFTLEKTQLRNEIRVLSGMVTSNYSKDIIETLPESTENVALVPTETFEQIEVLTTEKAKEPATTSIPTITTEEIIQTTTYPIHSTTKLVKQPSSSENPALNDQKKGESSVEKLTATPLSTFLAPNGHQPQFKPNVKSTITKVASPHHPKPDPQPQVNIEYPTVSDPQPHREGKNSHNFIANPNSSLTDDNVDKGWYFANYNRTDLKPFVAKITNSSQRGYNQGSQILVCISYLTLIMLI